MFDGKFTMIGFSKRKDDPSKYYHCQIHQESRLLPMPGEEGMYRCPQCGLPYNASNVKSDTKITSKFSVEPNPKKLLSLREKPDKKYYDAQGNEIPKSDKEAMLDLAQGRTIVQYRTTEDMTEDKIKKEPYSYHHVKKR
jgi:hypothetical protein